MRRYYTPRIPLGNTSLVIPTLQLGASAVPPTINQAGAGQAPGAVSNQRVVNQGGATNDQTRAGGSVSFGQSVYWEPPITGGIPDTYVIQRNLFSAGALSGWSDFASVPHTGASRYVYTDNATPNIYNATNVQEDGGAAIPTGPTTTAAYRVLAAIGGVNGTRGPPAAQTKMMFYEGATPPSWDSTIGYLIGDRVARSGNNYYARSSNINVDPLTNSTIWWQMTGGNVCNGPSFNLSFPSPADCNFTHAVSGGVNLRYTASQGAGSGIQLSLNAPLTWAYAGEIGAFSLPIADGFFTFDLTPSRTAMALHFAFHTRAPIGDVEPHTNAIDITQYGPAPVAGVKGTYLIPLKATQFGISTGTVSITNGVMALSNLSGPGVDAATWVASSSITTGTYVNTNPPQVGNGNYPVTGQANAASASATLYHTSAYKWQIVLADANPGDFIDLDNIGVVANAQSQTKKWAPGHGGLFFYGAAGLSNYTAIRKVQYDSDKTVLNSNFSGYLYMGRWIEWEPSFNNYSIATIQQDIQYLATLGRNFGFKVSTYGGGANPNSIIPAYLYDTANPNYNAAQYGPGYYGAQTQTSSTASNANMWRAAYYWPGIVTRVVALHTWLAQQAPITVNGVNYTGLDNVPNLLWVCLDEETQPSNIGACLTANGWGTDTYDGTNWVNAYMSMIQQIGAVWKKTNVLIPYNWAFVDGPASNTVTAVNNLMQQIVTSNCVISPPDTLPNGTGTIGSTTKQYTYGVAAYRGEWGGPNFTGQAPCMPLIEQPDMPGGVFYNGPTPSGSPARQGFDFNNALNSTILQCANQFWQIQPGGPLGSNWQNDIRPVINNTPLPGTPNGVYPPLYP